MPSYGVAFMRALRASPFTRSILRRLSVMVSALQETDRSFLSPVDNPVLTRDSPAPRSLERAPPQWFRFSDAPKRVVENRFDQRVDFIGSFPAVLSPVPVIL